MPNLERRQALIEHLKQNGILGVFHYLPLHVSEMGRKYGGKLGDCPVTERVSDCLVRLPFYGALTISEQEKLAVVFNVLDHIEKPHGRDNTIEKAGLPQGSAYHMANSTL
jgi:dTDP-4-amino-4,6-dideoxygalactose transaminase